MIISEHASISNLGQDYSGYTPEGGVKSRVSAIVTEGGMAADGVLVQLLDLSKKVILGQEKTDYAGRVFFDTNTAYQPVYLKIIPPQGKSAYPPEKRSMTWPIAGGIFAVWDYFKRNWDWDRSESFSIGVTGESAPSSAPTAPGEKKDSFEDLFTTKNILMVAGVVVGSMVIYNLLTGRLSSD